MLNRSEFWNLVESVVRAEGLTLFDIEVPSGQSGIVRIYITRQVNAQPGEKQNVGIDDCARVSKSLSRHADFEASFPENCVLEVSSPGINRKLSRPEHFADAIGERVRLTVSKYTSPSAAVSSASGAGRKQGKSTLKGKLIACNSNELQVADEVLKETVSVALSDVQDARVDFQFNKK